MWTAMLYLPIKKDWIISRVAGRVYFVCALASFSLFGGFIATRMAMQVSGASSLGESSAFLVRILLCPGIFGTALLSIAM